MTYPRPWYNSLDEVRRERLFAHMRMLGEQCDAARVKARKLMNPYGSIPVGGAHFDAQLRVFILDELLYRLRVGDDINDAFRVVRKIRTEAVERWNTQRLDYQVHRSLEADEHFIDQLERNLKIVVDV